MHQKASANSYFVVEINACGWQQPVQLLMPAVTSAIHLLVKLELWPGGCAVIPDQHSGLDLLDGIS
jgi:hypothetical protein